jgi:hypothetical protein
VFAFGNLAGDAGDASPRDGAAVVTDADDAAALKNRRGSSTPSDPLDHNRDFAVNDADADVARRNLGAMLQLITGGDLSQSPVRRRRPEAPITG